MPNKSILTRQHFKAIVKALEEKGLAQNDIAWSETVKPPKNPEVFAIEAIFVICNSGMKHTIAQRIFDKAVLALREGKSTSTVFGHKGKAGAMDFIWENRDTLFQEFIQADDKVAYCQSLPWIGPITRYHLAKNFGVDCAKPDIHLQRMANLGEESVDDLCLRLAKASGYRVATVDLILWRASASGIINSWTGEFR